MASPERSFHFRNFQVVDEYWLRPPSKWMSEGLANMIPLHLLNEMEGAEETCRGPRFHAAEYQLLLFANHLLPNIIDRYHLFFHIP